LRSDIRNYVTEQVPWKVTKTFILDRAVGGRGAHITVDPPPFVSAGCGQQRTKRRPNDRKRLTALGEQALARPQRVRVKGQLWCGSTVWRLIYECKGTVLCDGRCSMRVALSATVAQVHSELVQFDVYRCGAVVTSAQGWHSCTIEWDPAALKRHEKQLQPTLHAVAANAGEKVLALKAELVAAEEEEADEDVPMGQHLAAKRRMHEVRQQLDGARAVAKHAKREAAPSVPQGCRDRIVRLGADGHHANKVRQLLHRDGGDAPPQHYAQAVLDKATRCSRGVGPDGRALHAYDALHDMCHGPLLTQRVILYHIPDPAVDPTQYPGGYRLPAEAMHLVVFATVPPPAHEYHDQQSGLTEIHLCLAMLILILM
jgi:hypothetical protein